MESIKKSFSNCSVCPLLETPSCILETNSEDDLSKVSVVFIAENPGKQEVKEMRPLVGTSGRIFRKYFEQFGLNKVKYLLTNVVLCQTLNPDGTTGNPEKDVIELCKENCMNIVRVCNPDLVVLLGTSPMSAFGIAKSGITNIHGQIFDWEGYKVFLTVHPSFVNRNKALWTPKFEEDIAKVAELLSGKKVDIKTSSEGKKLGKGIHRYQIPEKFYTDEYRLIDIQYLNRANKVLYIFRDKDNNKIFHKENDDFIYYQVPDGLEARKLVPYNKLVHFSIPYKDRFSLDPKITYEGDIKITAKHAMDYYFFNKGEANKTKNNIMFCDIEVDTGKETIFPTPKKALFPINMITTILNGKKITYVIDNKTEPIIDQEGIEIKTFTNERQLLNSFIKNFKKADPDFMSGWNFINFDMDYVSNRMTKIGMQPNTLSNFGEVYVDGSKYICKIPGCVVLDQEFLYRTFTFTKMENYKLGFIAQHELGITKIQLPLKFNEMYWKMLNKTIEYNIRDTEILEKLEAKMAHINLLNELRIICNASFDTGSSSFGQIDTLMVSYLNKKGLASKNADPHIVKESYPGAFVFEPIPGIYDHITDFDFASLYPSLMITYNIGVNSYVMKTKDPHLGYELTYYPQNLPEKIDIIIDPMYENKLVTITKGQLLKKIKDNNLVFTINGCFFKPHKKEFSVFGEVVDDLMKSRKEYKIKMFDAIEKEDQNLEDFYYTRQLVYKVLANTLYGVVANKAFRFFDVSLAGAITLGGQEALKTSIIEADAFMRHLDTDKPYIKPDPLTKKEIFGDKMPDRNNEYIVTGDTDSIFCCFSGFGTNLKVKDIHDWCAKLEDFLNNDKISDVVKKHNVDLDYNRLVLKNELVIARGLFLAKKRYAIRVINNEGKDVDKIVSMGLETKRSDWGSKTKEFLNELLEMILKDEVISLSKIISYIDIKKKEFIRLINEGSKQVARPCSYGKDLKDYKTITQAVRAMENWNKLIYTIHRPGAKAYLFHVTGIDVYKAPENVRESYHKFLSTGNKLDVIGIPDEENSLPDYFLINTKANLKTSFEDRYKLLLAPILEAKQINKILTI